MFYKYLRLTIGNKLFKFSIKYRDVDDLLKIVSEICNLHNFNRVNGDQLFMIHLDNNYYDVPNEINWLEI